MSPKGTQPATVPLRGLQAVLNPAVLYPLAWRYCMTAGTSATHWEPPAPIRALAIETFIPLGRKRLVNAAETQGTPLGLTPQGAKPCAVGPLPTPYGPDRMRVVW